MKHLPLTIFIAIYLTACHSAPTVNKPAETYSLPEFSFVANGYFIILEKTADTSWGTGAPSLWFDSDKHTVGSSRSIQPDSVPAKYRSLLNTKVMVYSKDGDEHEAIIKGFSLYTAVVPHVEQEQEWTTQHTSELDRAMDISKMAEPLLVANFVIYKKLARSELRFAMPHGHASPIIYKGKDDDTTYKTVLNNTLYTSAEFKRIQQTYDSTAEVPGTKWWEDEWDQYWMTFSLEDKPQIITNTYQAGNPCSDQFYVSRLFIWKMNAANTPELIGTLPDDYVPKMMVDIDHDGTPEILAKKQLMTYVFLKKQGSEWIEIDTWTIPYFDCPC